jgi:hypothetical protein
MRALFITAAAVTAAIAVCGCPYKKPQEPLPGPKVSLTPALPSWRAAAPAAVQGGAGERPAEIRWFQGTLDEAFTRLPCTGDHPELRY